MNHPSPLQPWLDALFTRAARFEISFLGVPGRLRLPDGWATAVPCLPDHLFYYVVEGRFDAEVNGEVFTVVGNDLLWAGRGATVRFYLPPGEKLVIWRFRLQALQADGTPLDAPWPFRHLSPARGCETWMEQMVDEVSYPAEHSAERQRALLVCLLTAIARLDVGMESESGRLTRSQRECIARYFADHAADWPSPADLARAVDLSPDYFARCFRRTYGLPPRRWLVEERQRLAALRLLESTQNISQIARELGYADVFLFSRQFKTVTGMSPTGYRRGYGGVVDLHM